MELVFNELSFQPFANNSTEAEKRFIELLNTFKEANNVYHFSHMRFPQNYSDMQITTCETFAEWIANLKTPLIKNLILPLFRRPFMDDLNEDNINEFFKSSYTVDSNDSPNKSDPYGLPIAHIMSVPTISLNSHSFWENRKLRINKTNENVDENSSFDVYNICKVNDVKELEIIEWANTYYSLTIYDEKSLTHFLSFSKYEIIYSDYFLNQLLNWKNENINIYKYVLLLMKDAELHPFTGGMGKTENLKERGKESSKRISLQDRLSYSLENNIITFISCKGHYKFH